MVMNAGKRGEEEDRIRLCRVIEPSMCYISLLYENDCDAF